MKQGKLVRRLYEACLEHDLVKLQELRMEEFAKIIKRKSKGKGFDAKWTVVRF